MDKRPREIFNSYDRITNEEIVESIQLYIKQKYNVLFDYNDLTNGFFIKNPLFKKMSQEMKIALLKDLINLNFSFSHFIQTSLKNLIEAKDIYKDERWYQYDLKEFLECGLIDKMNFKDDGAITVNTLFGIFDFFSLCNPETTKSNLIQLASLNQLNAMCFSNAIDMLETNKKGNINVIQITDATCTYLHAIYQNEELAYDLNYLLAYPYKQIHNLYNCKLIKKFDLSSWEYAKNNYIYEKPESLLVATSISNNYEDIQAMIKYLDSFQEFQSRKK